jgi:hypothetical protein
VRGLDVHTFVFLFVFLVVLGGRYYFLVIVIFLFAFVGCGLRVFISIWKGLESVRSFGAENRRIWIGDRRGDATTIDMKGEVGRDMRPSMTSKAEKAINSLFFLLALIWRESLEFFLLLIGFLLSLTWADHLYCVRVVWGWRVGGGEV